MADTVKVAIVGGSGLLGRHIAKGLRRNGDDVLVLSRDPSAARRRNPDGPPVVVWSPLDPAGLAATLRGVDAVINLAGVPVGPRPWTPGRRRAISASRIQTTRAIIDAIAALAPADRPRVVVSASGTDAYAGRDRVVATEATPPSDGFLARVCLAWEREADRAVASGARVVVLRIGFVLARDAASLALYALPFRLRLGGRIGDGRQWMSWIHIDDLVELVAFVLRDPAAVGIINAVAPTPSREADVAEAIGESLGRRSWLPVPAWLLRLAMREGAILPLGSRRIVPVRALGLGFRFAWTDLRAAMADVLSPR